MKWNPEVPKEYGYYWYKYCSGSVDLVFIQGNKVTSFHWHRQDPKNRVQVDTRERWERMNGRGFSKKVPHPEATPEITNIG